MKKELLWMRTALIIISSRSIMNITGLTMSFMTAVGA